MTALLRSAHERNSTEMISIPKNTTTLIGQMIHLQHIAAYGALVGHWHIKNVKVNCNKYKIRLENIKL